MPIRRITSALLAWAALGAVHAAAGSVDTVVYFSPVMQRDMRYLVYLPADYAAKAAQGDSFPAVYLLHCAGCTDWRWGSGSYANVPAALDRYDLIAVAPYDGTNPYGYGWWLDSPRRPESKLATFVAMELKHRIDSAYATLPGRGNTALTGHSMGGFGSFHLLIEYNHLYAISVPIKAGVDLRYPLRNSWVDDFGLFALLGDTVPDSANWQAVNVLRNAHRLGASQQHLRFYSGQYDSWFSAENDELHALLDSFNIAHEYVRLAEDHFAVSPELMLEVFAFIDSVSERGPTQTRPSGRRAPMPHKQQGGPLKYDLRGQRLKRSGGTRCSGVCIQVDGVSRLKVLK